MSWNSLWPPVGISLCPVGLQSLKYSTSRKTFPILFGNSCLKVRLRKVQLWQGWERGLGLYWYLLGTTTDQHLPSRIDHSFGEHIFGRNDIYPSYGQHLFSKLLSSPLLALHRPFCPKWVRLPFIQC